ncbi:MAG: hypothetical protein LKI67_04080 [Olsenella sp.]|jgi:Zn-dependent alcohol dehydrogenase|nr:hypothetical protein [Olsenella sp.]MCI1645291.1 hypothetical protein [Olsenella sp.]MCI1792576.1 hypothetical protein [Olsenella sp.]MCI1811017.1 hypothetical protein [Olsenella sp.]MCI1879155.1 hypothetical protein [Olsenella sp.]
MRVKALVVHEKNGPYCMEAVELDEPRDNEVLVRNVASGICHTDEFGRSQGVPTRCRWFLAMRAPASSSAWALTWTTSNLETTWA